MLWGIYSSRLQIVENDVAVLFFFTYESSLAARVPASSELREGGISTTRHEMPRLQCSTALVRPGEMKRSCQKGEVSEPRPGEKYAFSCLKSHAMWKGSPRYVKGGTPPEEEWATLAGRISPNQAAQMGRQVSLDPKGCIVGSNQRLMRPPTCKATNLLERDREMLSGWENPEFLQVQTVATCLF